MEHSEAFESDEDANVIANIGDVCWLNIQKEDPGATLSFLGFNL